MSLSHILSNVLSLSNVKTSYRQFCRKCLVLKVTQVYVFTVINLLTIIYKLENMTPKGNKISFSLLSMCGCLKLNDCMPAQTINIFSRWLSSVNFLDDSLWKLFFKERKTTGDPKGNHQVVAYQNKMPLFYNIFIINSFSPKKIHKSSVIEDLLQCEFLFDRKLEINYGNFKKQGIFSYILFLFQNNSSLRTDYLLSR